MPSAGRGLAICEVLNVRMNIRLLKKDQDSTKECGRNNLGWQGGWSRDMDSANMPIKQILFRTSYIFAIVGGLIALVGDWLLGQPIVGANIGAEILILSATGLMFVAVATCIAALNTTFLGKMTLRT